jgi:cobalamin biosynthesis protein CobD/CbiB
MIELPWMGNGREHMTRADISAGLKIYDRSLWIMLATLVASAVIL